MKYHLCQNGAYIRLATTHLTTNEIFCTLLEALFQASLVDVFGCTMNATATESQ